MKWYGLLRQTISFQKFKGCLSQILLGPFFNTLTHMYVKLSEPKWWNHVKNHFMSNHQIVVNFSESHRTCYIANEYVCKKDCKVIHSQNHPDLLEVCLPKTKNCIKAYKQSCRKLSSLSTSNLSTPKTKRLQNTYISKVLVANNIKAENNLLNGRKISKSLSSANLQKSCKIFSPQLRKWGKLPQISRGSKNTKWKSLVKPFEKECVEEYSGSWYCCTL